MGSLDTKFFSLCMFLSLLLLVQGNLLFAQELQELKDIDKKQENLNETPQSRGFCVPLQVAIITPLQLVPSKNDVCGLRLDILYGENTKSYGLDIGLWNVSEFFAGVGFGIANKTSDLKGVQVGFSNVDTSEGNGIQIGILNGSGSEFNGVQFGLLNDTDSVIMDSKEVNGLQVGLVNTSLLGLAPWSPEDVDLIGNTKFKGVQFGLFNAKKTSTGLSIGLYNISESFYGLQFGLVNYTYEMEGLQLGLLNFIDKSNIPFMPFVNVAW